MARSTRPTRLLYFPRDDFELERVTEAVLSLHKDGAVSDEALAGIVTAELRRYFPKAVVRSRDRLAELSPCDTAWYVYRDGGAVAGRGHTADEGARSAEADEAATAEGPGGSAGLEH
jgi:hypothetical protein